MKFKVFISSRNNDKLIVGESNDQTPSDITWGDYKFGFLTGLLDEID